MLMRRIYSEASHTIIYLGDLTPEAAEVFAAAPRQSCNIASDLGGKDIDEIIDLAARDILSRPWFKRVWVFQELVLSRDPWVQCGRTRVRWTDLCRLLRPGNRQKKLGLLKDMAAGRTRKGSFSLFEALQARRGLGATDPRDFVFANLSIASDSPFAADYSKSTQWVFSQIGIYLVKQLGIDGFVDDLVDEISPEERVEGLPSWTPDWTRAPHGLPPFDQQKKISWRLKEKRNSPQREIPRAFTGGDLPVVLGLPGSELDIVDTTCGVIPRTPGDIYAEQSFEPDSGSDPGEHSERTWDKTGDRLSPSQRSRYRDYERKTRAQARFFQDLEKPSAGEASGDGAFFASFSRWKFAMYESGYDYDGRRTSIDYVEEYFDQTSTATPLGGRRLAMTRDGFCCVVPNQTRKGDIIGCLMPRRFTVVLRRVQRPQEQEITAALVQGLRGQELWEGDWDPRGGEMKDYDGHGNPPGCWNATLCWEVQDDVANVDIGHYIIVGACHFNSTGPCSETYNGHVKVFALH